MSDILKTHTGVRVRFRWASTSRSLSPEIIENFASEQVSDPDALILKKNLLSVKVPSYKRVVKVRTQIRDFWIKRTLPSLERGVRLINNERLASFQEEMNEWAVKFREAVLELDNDWPSIVSTMREKLGNLFDPEDYTLTPSNVMAVQWDYVSLGLPKFLSEEVYKQEVDKFQEKVKTTLDLIKLTFVGEFNTLVHNLVDRLSPDPETGQRKRFKAATVENLREFFKRFQELDCTDDAQLQEMITKAESILQGVDPEILRENADLRTSIRSQFEEIEKALGDARDSIISGFSRQLLV